MKFRKNISRSKRPDHQSEIIKKLRSGIQPDMLAVSLKEYHENDIAEAMEVMTAKERQLIYGLLDPETLSDVLEHSGHIKDYIDELDFKSKVQILSELEPNTAVEYLLESDHDERHRILENMDEESKNSIYLLSTFGEEEIGSRMSTNYICIRNDSSIRSAMKGLVSQAADNDNISTIYVVDENNVFKGAIDLKDLIIAREHTDLDSIISKSYPYVYTDETVEECIDYLMDYSEDSIPVLDSSDRLIGVITSQDIAKINDDEMTDDYAKLAGLTEESDLNEPVMTGISKRLPWLIILLCLGLIVSSVVGLFENIVAHLTLIITFQSLILDMAGNVGTQSLAVTIRVLMDDRIKGRQKTALVIKEARIGLINGTILGTLSFVVIGCYLMFFKSCTMAMAFSISFCTGAALMIAMLLSSITGTAVPLLFKSLNIDPAVASGPLITTLNDLVAVVTYYGLSWILLINIMGF